jgi:hypothetical protein
MTREEAAEVSIELVTANNGWHYERHYECDVRWRELICSGCLASYAYMSHDNPKAKHADGCLVKAIIEATR